ncbi:hypothetical protein BH23PLA1_BH23PLA1_16540 [soil metagenome]
MLWPHLRLAALLAAALILTAPRAPALAFFDTAVELERARAALADRQGRAAVTILETALTSAPATDRPALLGELRRAYELAALQAEAAGQIRLAEAYCDNLKLLEQAAPKAESAGVAPAPAEPDPKTPPEPPAPIESVIPTPAPAPAPGPIEAPTATEPGSIAVDPADQPFGEPFETLPIPDSPGSIPNRPRTDLGEPSPGRDEIPTLAPPSTGEPEQIVPPSRPEVNLPEADAAFRAGRYDDAGRLYGTLAAEGTLPESRHDHWAYCRCVAVVRRINAQPESRDEWAEIQSEIREIRKLAPRNWFSEYLRNLAQQRSTQMAQAHPSQFVVRGSSPEETESPRPPGRPAMAPPASDRAVAGTPSAPSSGAQAVGNWQVRTTPNFRILHADAALAERIAEAAEAAREVISRRWTGSSPAGPWAPRCDIYLYPDARTFSDRTGQPADSPGFSTMGLNNGRVIARRVNLRADAPKLVEAVLPHEITHVVLADLFPTTQIPRWADEGIAVLSEPVSEQQARAADLVEPLAEGQLFRVQTLMTSDYPDGRYWDLFYAQSVSLTRFLVEQGDAGRFIAFLQGAQRQGFESELRRVYAIDGFEDLQTRWLAYARRQAESPGAGDSVPARIASEESATRRE